MEKISLTPQTLKDSAGNNQSPLFHSLGKGHIQWVCLKSGIKLLFMDYTPRRPITLAWTPPSDPLGFGFCLSGRIRGRLAGEKECKSARPGKAAFKLQPNMASANYFPNISGVTETYGTERIIRVAFFMDLEQFFSFTGEQMNHLAVQLEHRPNGMFRSQDRVTRAMCATVFQILNCPYQGTARSFFLESKVLELVAHKIAQIEAVYSRKSNGARLPSSDVERVQEAARLLTCDLENTPDMNTLAQSVGLSRTSLYRQFQKVHGVPPFEYLRNHRLKTAMQLLQAREANVSEAAFLVGYSNMSHFTKAFKLMFGILPSELLNHSAVIRT